MTEKAWLKWMGWMAVLAGIACAVSLISLSVGSAGIPVSRIFSILREGRLGSEYGILVDVRLPRIFLGLAVGGALGLAGVILQGMFRNPLVEPYTLGISGGSALGVSMAVLLGLGTLHVWCLPVAGFAGALAVIALVYWISVREGRMGLEGLLLTGVMISFISSSLMMLLMALANSEDLHGIIFWIMGSLEEPNLALIRLVIMLSLVLTAVAFFFWMDLNALTLGEEEAVHLGISVEKVKKILFLTASALTALSVSVAGVIGFVGLVVPHFMRRLVGNDHRILIPASYLAGGAFLVCCDTLARTLISPLELPVGVMTGILGGGLFVWVLSRKRAEK